MFRAELAEVILYPRGTEDGGAADARRGTKASPRSWSPTDRPQADPLHARIRDVEPRRSSCRPASRATDASRATWSARCGASRHHRLVGISQPAHGRDDFWEDDLRLLETLANQAAVALENGHLEQSLAELSRLKEELRFQAYHDPLTGLANRTLFLDQVEARLEDAKPAGCRVVLFLDLDDFKIVNDTMGHAAGDRLLIGVAERLREVLRPTDVAARLGGDEFAVLLEDGPELGDAVTVADRIVDVLRSPFPIEGQDIVVGGSIGCRGADAPDRPTDELLRNADVAMYTAKGAGKNRVSVFEPTMHAEIVARHALSAELSRSLGRGELVVFFQPIVALQTSRVAGFEALVRWRHPSRGLISPAEFIPLAEETGVIRALGRYVLEEACTQAAAWRVRPGAERLTVAVNLSAQQLQEPSFIEDLSDRRGQRHRAGAGVLEMTETVMFHETSTTLTRLAAIRELGVRSRSTTSGPGTPHSATFAGSGSTSSRSPASSCGPAERSEDWAFAAAIVALGRTLHLPSSPRASSGSDSWSGFAALGCELGQGYLFAPTRLSMRMPRCGS